MFIASLCVAATLGRAQQTDDPVNDGPCSQPPVDPSVVTCIPPVDPSVNDSSATDDWAEILYLLALMGASQPQPVIDDSQHGGQGPGIGDEDQFIWWEDEFPQIDDSDSHWGSGCC